MLRQYFLDTNVIVRLLLEDSLEQLTIVKKYFQKAKEAKLRLKLPLFIIIETAHVFRTFYGIPKEKICAQLIKIVSVPYLIIDDKMLVLEALGLYKGSSADFVDCILFATASEQNAEVLSFDKDLKKLAKT